MIDFTPNPIALALGPLEIRWYGIGYVAAIVAGTWLATREARRRGEREDVIIDGVVFLAIAALIGGRAYHIIDQWAYYQNHLAQIVLPPYTGLGIYGGLFTGMLATIWFARRRHLSFWRWGDILAPCILLAQAIGRWGNFMNQELYGPPTNLPWGIAIQCANRTPAWACPADGGTTPIDAHFVPLFLYESISGLVGAVVLILLARRVRSLRPGDLVLLFFAWYGTTRFLLEPLRTNNWLLGGVPTASIISAVAVVGALVVLAWRHRPGAAAGDAGSAAESGGASMRAGGPGSDEAVDDLPGSPAPAVPPAATLDGPP